MAEYWIIFIYMYYLSVFAQNGQFSNDVHILLSFRPEAMTPWKGVLQFHLGTSSAISNEW